MPTTSDTKKPKGKKKVQIIEDTPQPVRTRPIRVAATPKSKAPPAGKKKSKDPAPGSLSVQKALVIATPKAERKMPKRGAKIEETSSDGEDGETDDQPSSSELSGDEIEDDGDATDEFATVIRGPPTVTDGEDAAEETDDDKTKKRKRSRKSPTAPHKSARKEGQTAPERKLSVDASEAAAASSTAPATTSTSLTASAPAMPEPVVPAPATTSAAPTMSAPAMPEPVVPAPATTSAAPTTSTPAIPDPVVTAPAAVATTPSLTIVAGASPLKKVAADGGAKALLANAEKLHKSMASYVDITESDSSMRAEPSKGKKVKKDAKTKPKKKKSQKQKDKGEKEKKESKQPIDSDIEMDESDEIQPTKGKSRDAGSTRQEIQAQIRKLQKLLANKPQSDAESTESDVEIIGSGESSENEDEDTKPTKKGKEPAKKGKSKQKEKKKVAAEDPGSFTYYKGLSADSRKIVQDLKDRFTRAMFEDWWPEGTERIDWGEKAYTDSVKAWKEVIIISSGEEMRPLKSKEKAKHTPPFRYDDDVFNFPTEIRNGIRNVTVPTVEAAYEIRKMPADYSGTAIEYTREVVANLLDNFSFAKDPDDSTAIVGSHPVVVTLMTKHFGKPEYMRDKEMVKVLTPMPATCIAIMIAATRYALDRFADGGTPKKLSFQEAPYKDIYYDALRLLLEAKKNNPVKYSSLMEQYRDALPNIGANASKWRMAAAAFETDVKEEDEEA